MKTNKLRALALPLVGFAGGILAMVWPIGHATFCAGFSGLGV